MAGRWPSTDAAPNATSISRRCCAHRAATAKPSRILARPPRSSATMCGALRLPTCWRTNDLDGASSGAADPLAWRTARQQGHLDEAAEQFRQVVALKPDFAEAYSNLGVVLAAQGRFLEAAEQYRRALSIKPEPGRHLSQSRPRAAGGRTGGRSRWQRSHAASRSARPTKPRRSSFSARSRRRMSLPERLSAISLPAP